MERCVLRAIRIAVCLLAISMTVAEASAQGYEDGAPVCTATDAQVAVTICSDDTNGVYVAWLDPRGNNRDVYIQRLGPLGLGLWESDGVEVCGHPSSQGYIGNYPRLAMTADGNGGAIVVWNDNRNGSDQADLFAQLIDRTGERQWAPDGVTLCSAPDDQFEAEVVSDGAGGAIAVWGDQRNSGQYTVYVQRVDEMGAIPSPWPADGVRVVTTDAGGLFWPALAPDGAGGVIVAWHHTLNGDIFAQKLDADGNLLWTDDTDNGVAVCTYSGFQNDPTVISDGVGGVIIAWFDRRNGAGGSDEGDIYVQRLSADGVPQWTEDGVALSSTGTAGREPFLGTDDAGGTIVVWSDVANGDSDVYAARITNAGDISWSPSPKPVCEVSDSVQKYGKVVQDGLGGTILAWVDDRNEQDNFDIYAQNLDPAGEPLWTLNGEPICTAPEDQSAVDPSTPALAYIPNRGAMIAWEDNREGGDVQTDIYAEGINILGDWGFGELCSAAEQAIPDDDPTGISDIINVALPGARMSRVWVFVNIVHEAIGDLVMTLASPGDTVTVTLHERSGGEDDSLIGWYNVNLTPVDHLGAFTTHYAEGDWTLTVTDEVEGAVGALHDWCLAFWRDPNLTDVQPEAVPAFFGVSKAAPNPFNPQTTIHYELSADARIDLTIFDVQGQRVATLVSGQVPAGRHEAIWDGRDGRGRPVASGTYVSRLEANGRTSAVKMVLVK